MALVVQISIRTSCGYLKYVDDFGQLVSHDCAIFEYFQAVQKRLCKPPSSGKIEITDDGGF